MNNEAEMLVALEALKERTSYLSQDMKEITDDIKHQTLRIGARVDAHEEVR